MISSKSHYALIAILDIAIHSNTLVTIKEISKRQDISQKYLEQVISLLVKNNLLRSFRGNNGGYSLSKKEDEYNAYEIILAVDGEVKFEFDHDVLSSFWADYTKYNKEYLKNIKLTSLIEKYNEQNEIYNYYI